MLCCASIMPMKKHLMVLDGLRGTAAISVMLFHLQSLSVDPANINGVWLRHAYLAVDFFFCLSGYVIGYAYDDRRSQMSISEFFAARLIRLHPMVVMGIVIGVLSYAFDPFNHGVRNVPWLQLQDVALWKIVGCTLAGLLMLPSWPLPNRGDSYFPLNPPSWSLMWEYLANIAFALLLWRMRKPVLLIVALAASIAVAISAYEYNTLIVGYAWGQMSSALVRTAFSFSAGLLLYRYRCAIRSPLGFVSLSVLLAVIFIMPFERWNWIYESIVVIAVFPLIVAIGAAADASSRRPSNVFGGVRNAPRAK